MVLSFSAITYFLSNNLSKAQYSSQDMLLEYQNFVLYQMMVQKWNDNLNDKEQIINDLKQMNLSSYVGIYHDVNQNNELDLNIDTLIDSWAYRQNEQLFDYNDYERHGIYQMLADSLGLESAIMLPYASYGFFGINQLPATFVEFPAKDNKQQVVGYWLITDYPLPADISWPEIVLAFALIVILSLTFIIIRGFLQPIQNIIRHVKKLKRGTLNEKIPVTSNDELGKLSETINKMTEDINLLVNQKQNLLIDVSHELKTPLTRLKFIVANMQLNTEDNININKEINFLQDMISNMLLSDKLSTPYIEDLEKTEIILEKLIQSACDMFYQIDQKLKVIKNRDLGSVIIADPYKLSLAVKNLIDNALKYGNPKKLIELTVYNKNKSIEICVQDFGEGIKKEQINEIIKPLYRGRAAKEKNKTGFGLGLAITKKIVEAHDGVLKIESQEGKGSKFIIVLPKEVD